MVWLCVDAIEDNGWSEQVAIKYVTTFLSGKAVDWYKLEVRPVLTNQTTWQDFFSFFEANFLGAADRQRTRSLVNDTKQGQNETVSTFIPGFKRLLYLFYSDFSETEIVERVTEKLRPEYLRVICEKEPKTLTQLRDVCRRLEAGIDAAREVSSEPNKPKDYPRVSKFRDNNDKTKMGTRKQFPNLNIIL